MRTQLFIALGALLGMLGCRDEPTSPSGPAAVESRRTVGTAAAVTDSVILMVAGDMHACLNHHRERATAALIERYPQALVIPLGDNAGQSGTAEEYRCYDESWGKFKSLTYPVIGNHELNLEPTAKPYYDYFNGVGVDSGRAGRRGRGYYTLDTGGWRIFVANNNYRQPVDDQEAWMIRELATRPTRCAMAIWHRPLFTSSSKPAGVHTPSRFLPRWWKALYNGGVELVLNGHVHNYERFAELRPDGVVDTVRGIREFIVGTGGSGLYPFDAVHPASRKRVRTWGVLKLTLWPTYYKWQFIDTSGVVRDSGRDTCH